MNPGLPVKPSLFRAASERERERERAGSVVMPGCRLFVRARRVPVYVRRYKAWREPGHWLLLPLQSRTHSAVLVHSGRTKTWETIEGQEPWENINKKAYGK